MTKKISAIAIFIILLGIFSFSKEKTDGHARLSELIQEAVRNNPLIQSTYQDWQAALEKIPQVKSLPDPVAPV